MPRLETPPNPLPPHDADNGDNVRGLHIVSVVDMRETLSRPVATGSWRRAWPPGRDTRIYLRKCTGFRYAVDILGRKLFIVICMND